MRNHKVPTIGRKAQLAVAVAVCGRAADATARNLIFLLAGPAHPYISLLTVPVPTS